MASHQKIRLILFVTRSKNLDALFILKILRHLARHAMKLKRQVNNFFEPPQIGRDVSDPSLRSTRTICSLIISVARGNK